MASPQPEPPEMCDHTEHRKSGTWKCAKEKHGPVEIKYFSNSTPLLIPAHWMIPVPPATDDTTT